MPTRQVKTTNYFSHDSNARNDEKLLRLRMRLGAAGYGVYFMLLERLREEVDYTSAKDYNMIAFDLRVDAKLIKSVVEDFGLFAFTDDGKCFYSESFTRRMAMKDAKSEGRSKAGKAGMEARWGKRLKKVEDDGETADLPAPEKEPPRTSPPNPVDDDKALARFFRKENKADIETLLMNFGLKPAETSVLRSMAKEIITEWKLTDTRHADYNDWSRHLVNTMRIKRKERLDKNDGNKTEKQPPKQADYNYSGGFGSKDV